jgi:hypothetical protein
MLELLERYPEALTDAELAELRAAAEADAELDALLDAIHDVDAALRPGAVAALSELSGEARQRLAERLKATAEEQKRTGGVEPPHVEAPKGWSTGGAIPTGSAEEEAARAAFAEGANRVAELAGLRRQRVSFGRPMWGAVAAALLLMAGFMLKDQFQPPPHRAGSGGLDAVPPEFTFRGDGTEAKLSGQLFVMGVEAGAAPGGPAPAETQLDSGAARARTAPVTFRAVVPAAADAALLETQGGRSFVLYPPPGGRWTLQPGSNLLQPSGQAATYTPGAAGEARYSLLLSRRPLAGPAGGQLDSPEAWAASQAGVQIVDSRIIRWQEAMP